MLALERGLDPVAMVNDWPEEVFEALVLQAAAKAEGVEREELRRALNGER